MSEKELRVEAGSAEAAGVAACRPQTTAAAAESGAATEQRPPRLRTRHRQQSLPASTIDPLIEVDHPARDIWRFVEGFDRAVLYNRVRSRAGTPGRPAIDPQLLVALWLYAILSGYSSARELAVRCQKHNAFRWLAGGVSVNHHSLSDFLVAHLDFLEQLFKHSVAVWRRDGLVDLERVAQDGLRVRVSAGAASFRRRATLEILLQQAEQEVQRLEQLLAAVAEEDTSEVNERKDVASDKAEAGSAAQKPSAQQRAAQQRAAEKRLERPGLALERLPEMEAKKKAADKKEARVSTTDPEATVMKLGEGGYRPAYNIQFSSTCSRQSIVGVQVVTVGSDQGQLPPMLDQIEERFAERPQEALVDGGFANHRDSETVQQGEGEKGACTVYAPVPKPKKDHVDRHAAHPGDSQEVSEWRERMATDEAKKIDQERAATAECVNAQARNRGLVRLLVRGLLKVKALALWFASVHNMACGFALLPRPALTG